MLHSICQESAGQGSNLHSPLTGSSLGNKAGTSGCLFCNKKTKNPKFCSKSCAAKLNNKLYPKKPFTVKLFCVDCGVKIYTDKLKTRKRCRKCYLNFKDNNAVIATRTKAEVINNEYFGWRGIRDHARRTYNNSGRPYECFKCKYNVHVEVCHIRAIKDYPLDTLVSEINKPSNLIALCRNHHWEFDNDILKLETAALST